MYNVIYLGMFRLTNIGIAMIFATLIVTPAVYSGLVVNYDFSYLFPIKVNPLNLESIKTFP